MYNGLYNYLTEQAIHCSRQFGFQTGHSAEHAITNLTDQIQESFKKDRYTLDIFIDHSKAFDTVDHENPQKKLEMCGRGTALLNQT